MLWESPPLSRESLRPFFMGPASLGPKNSRTVMLDGAGVRQQLGVLGPMATQSVCCMLSKGGVPCRAYRPDVPSSLNGDNPWLRRAAGSVTSTGRTGNGEPLPLPRTGARPASSSVPLPLPPPPHRPPVPFCSCACVCVCSHEFLVLGREGTGCRETG